MLKDTLISYKLVLTFADMLVVQDTMNFIRMAPGITGTRKRACCERALLYAAQNEKAGRGAINKSPFLNSEHVNYNLQRKEVEGMN